MLMMYGTNMKNKRKIERHGNVISKFYFEKQR